MAKMDKVYLLVNGLYIVVRFFFQYSSINWTESIMYFLSLALESFLYVNLYQASRPRYDASGVLMDAGTDLGQPGLVSYMFDFIYISWATHVLSLATKWAWGLYMVIPAYAAVVFGPYVRDFLLPKGD
ncbi:hypothetical protein EC988_009747, partial [Linderina pennispora]